MSDDRDPEVGRRKKSAVGLPGIAHSRQYALEGMGAKRSLQTLLKMNHINGHLLLQTVRSHDQFNTSVYGMDDRYRGSKGGRRVVFVNADDLVAQGLQDGRHVDLVSVAPDGERRAPDFRIVAYDTPVGCSAAYFPETNVLVALDSTADESNTPASKSVVIRLQRR